MSLLNTGVLKVAPPAADMVELLDGGNSWEYGDWVEVIAATSADCNVAGICVGASSAYSNMEAEVEIGVGASGEEASIGLIRIYGPNSGTAHPGIYLLPVVTDTVDAGSRIALRYREHDVNLTPNVFGVLYYEGFDADISVPLTLTAAPLGTDSVSFTPNATAWANSAWVELSSGIGYSSLLAAIAPSNPSTTCDIEWDLGIGASGSEVVITTLRSAMMVSSRSGLLWYLNLPSLYPIDANVRVAARMRKSGTATDATTVSLLYYLNPVVPPTPPVPTDESSVIRILRQWGHFSDENFWIFWHEFELLMETGKGLVTGQGSDPVIEISYSNDYGHTFINAQNVSIGKIGEFRHRVRRLNLGRSRDRVWRLVCSEPIAITLLEATARISKGSS